MFNTNIIRTENRAFRDRQSPKERSLSPEDSARLVEPIDEEINTPVVWDEDRHYVEIYHPLNAIAR